jgi:hypothetical protein
MQDAATRQPGVSRWCCTAHRSHSAFDPLVTTTSRHMSVVRVAFQYDYQCDQIGMFAFLVKVTDFGTAAKCVMAMGNPDVTLEVRREALTLAAKNPQLVAGWTHREDEASSHMEDEWCQDLILATLQAISKICEAITSSGGSPKRNKRRRIRVVTKTSGQSIRTLLAWDRTRPPIG